MNDDAPLSFGPPTIPVGQYVGPMIFRHNGLPGARVDHQRAQQLHGVARDMATSCLLQCRMSGLAQTMRRYLAPDGTRVQVNVLAASYPPQVIAWIWTPELPVLEGQPVHINEDQVWIPGLFLVGDYVLEPPTGITPNFCELVAEQNGWRLFTRPKHPVTGTPLIDVAEFLSPSIATTSGVAAVTRDSKEKTWLCGTGLQKIKECDSSKWAIHYNGEAILCDKFYDYYPTYTRYAYGSLYLSAVKDGSIVQPGYHRCVGYISNNGVTWDDLEPSSTILTEARECDSSLNNSESYDAGYLILNRETLHLITIASVVSGSNNRIEKYTPFTYHIENCNISECNPYLGSCIYTATWTIVKDTSESTHITHTITTSTHYEVDYGLSKTVTGHSRNFNSTSTQWAWVDFERKDFSWTWWGDAKTCEDLYDASSLDNYCPGTTYTATSEFSRNNLLVYINSPSLGWWMEDSQHDEASYYQYDTLTTCPYNTTSITEGANRCTDRTALVDSSEKNAYLFSSAVSDEFMLGGVISSISVDLCAVVHASNDDAETTTIYGIYDKQPYSIESFRDIIKSSLDADFDADSGVYHAIRPYASKPVLLPLPQ